jgi:hypothetical protein
MVSLELSVCPAGPSMAYIKHSVWPIYIKQCVRPISSNVSGLYQGMCQAYIKQFVSPVSSNVLALSQAMCQGYVRLDYHCKVRCLSTNVNYSLRCDIHEALCVTSYTQTRATGTTLYSGTKATQLIV